jgi:methylenetetrahydrofolate dehydrogenase (NADP+)/methenyltetrahydrofolate cyclohydrolase
MTLLAENGIGVAGKHAVVVGRSIDVGRPMAALLTNADATVTICHSKTRNLPDETRRADILVSSVGKAHVITADMVKKGAVVIDVGINEIHGKLVGDVDFAAVQDIASAITPVPGGVGPMTIATLMENTFLAAKLKTCDTVW